jgi:hypothetical protein
MPVMGVRFLRFSVADRSATSMATCLSDKTQPKIKCGKNIVLMNYTIFNKTLMIKEQTSVGLCEDVMVPEALRKEAELIINPVATPKSPMKDIQVKERGQVVSVEGTISKVGRKLNLCGNKIISKMYMST